MSQQSNWLRNKCHRCHLVVTFFRCDSNLKRLVSQEGQDSSHRISHFSSFPSFLIMPRLQLWLRFFLYEYYAFFTSCLCFVCAFNCMWLHCMLCVQHFGGRMQNIAFLNTAFNLDFFIPSYITIWELVHESLKALEW